MANEKKVVFGADATGFIAAAEKMRQKLKDIGIDEAKINSLSKNSLQEQIRGYDQLFKQYEKQVKYQKELAAMREKEFRDYKTKFKASTDLEERAEMAKKWGARQVEFSKGLVAAPSQEKDEWSAVLSELKEQTKLQKGEKRGIFKDVLTANLVTEGIKKGFQMLGGVGSAITGVDDESQGVGQIYGSLTKAVGYSAGGVGALIGSIWPGLGAAMATSTVALTDLSAGMIEAGKNREEQEQKNRTISETRLSALTGKTIAPNTNLGLTSAESAQMAEQYARAGGTARNLESRVFDSYAMQKAFGLEGGQMLEQERLSKMTGVGSAQNTANMIAALKRSGVIKGDDYSKLPSLIEAQTAVIREQSQMMSNPNSGIAQGIVTSFSKLGGAFGDERLAERLSTVNQSLINPSGDFSQAMNFSALTSLPQYRNASYFDLIKAQQGGLSTEGFLGAKLGLLSQQYGGASSEGFKLGVMDATGLNAADSEKLAEAFKNNPNLFSKFAGTTTDLQKMLGSQPSGVTEYEVSAAKISQGYSDGFSEGIAAQMEVLGKKAGKEFAADWAKYFGLGTKEAGNKPVNGR